MAAPCALTQRASAAPCRASLRAARCSRRVPRSAAAPRAASGSASFAFASVEEAENALLSTVQGMRGRGAGASSEQETALLAALAALEADGGVANPVDSPLIEGEWRLLYTSKSKFDPANPLGARTDGSAPGLEAIFRTLFGGPASKALADGAARVVASSSPIQRTITSNDAFTVLQNVRLSGPGRTGVVDQIVRFGDVGELLLSASASTPASSRRRIDFAFELGEFSFKALPFKIPYPVPFKLLGDEAKGWLDTRYLSQRLRVSVGNKGTTFVLSRV